MRTLASAVDAANAPSVLLLAHELGEPALERAAVATDLCGLGGGGGSATRAARE